MAGPWAEQNPEGELSTGEHACTLLSLLLTGCDSLLRVLACLDFFAVMSCNPEL